MEEITSDIVQPSLCGESKCRRYFNTELKIRTIALRHVHHAIVKTVMEKIVNLPM